MDDKTKEQLALVALLAAFAPKLLGSLAILFWVIMGILFILTDVVHYGQ